jgi:hypothetical protein
MRIYAKNKLYITCYSVQEITDTGMCVQQTFYRNLILILIAIDFILNILRWKMF